MKGRSRKQVIRENEISEIDTVSLAGFEQKILIEGKRLDLPIIINLHGGPGSPIPFSVGTRGMFPEFTDQYIMVCWDQLGCGINNYKIEQKLTIDLYVHMAVDLIKEIRKRYPKNKVYLFALSWGSVLAAKICEMHTNLLDGIIVWGQLIKNVFLNDEVNTALKNSKLPEKKLEQIQKLNVNEISAKDIKMVALAIQKYTYGYVNKNGKQPPIGKIVHGLLMSPDYHMKDFKAIVVNQASGNSDLWRELVKLDLTNVISNTDIPYYILQGDTDIVASTRQVQKLVKEAGNPLLHLTIVKNAGHNPGAFAMETVLKTFRQICK